MLIYHQLYYTMVSKPDFKIDTAVSYGIRSHVKGLLNRLYVFDSLGIKPSFAESTLTPEDIAHIQEILCE